MRNLLEYPIKADECIKYLDRIEFEYDQWFDSLGPGEIPYGDMTGLFIASIKE